MEELFYFLTAGSAPPVPPTTSFTLDFDYLRSIALQFTRGGVAPSGVAFDAAVAFNSGSTSFNGVAVSTTPFDSATISFDSTSTAFDGVSAAVSELAPFTIDFDHLRALPLEMAVQPGAPPCP